MAARKTAPASADVMADLRRRAAETRQKLAHKPAPAELLSPEEMANAAPFYFVLRSYVQELKQVRIAAGLTLADVSARTGMAVESLSRLETGAQTNPTWKTLGLYAAAVGCRPQLTAEADSTEART
jgi:DNA-binding XRE family transcriptional regulator